MSDGLPLIVGVTGHRNLREGDEPRLRAAFAGVLEELRAKYPATRLMVLSGFAAGADLLAAEVALEEKIEVVPCFPMPKEQYEHDFAGAERARFEAVLARSSEPRIVPASSHHGSAYTALGAFIAYHSHILVAFWDGRKGGGSGGTADIVRMRSTGLSSTAGSPDVYVPDIGPIYQIVTPRRDEPAPAKPFEVIVHHPRRFRGDKRMERDFAEAVKRLNGYNHDLETLGGAQKAGGLLALMKRTDQAANVLQRQTLFYVNLLYVLAAIASIVQIALGSEAVRLGAYSIPSEGLKIGTLFVAFLAFLFARAHDYEDRYQDYRALGEGLRVQYAWCDAGLGDRLVEASYLKMQQSELQWIRLALRTAYFIYCGSCAAEGGSADRAECLLWIRDQWRYYYRRARSEKANQRACTYVARGVLVAGGVLAAASFVFLIPSHPLGDGFGISHDVLVRMTTAPIAIAALIGALLSGYSAKRSFASNAKRYQRMFLVFDHARRRLSNSARGLGGEPKEIVHELGREALSEHADWLLLRREYPLSLVVD